MPDVSVASSITLLLVSLLLFLLALKLVELLGLYFVDVVYPEKFGLPSSAASVSPLTGDLLF